MNDNADNGKNKPNNNHNKHKSLYHWVYVAGYIIITAPMDFFFLWPETHLGAFLGLAALLSLPTIAKGLESRRNWEQRFQRLGAQSRRVHRGPPERVMAAIAIATAATATAKP